MATITDAMAVRALQRGDVLFSEGDEPTELSVVTSVAIAISNQSVDGRESMMALMERGDLFGEMPLFDQMDRSAGARRSRRPR
ncbi:MAG: cyclic nucleotide-binding domain-containing protein [Acidimicrobiales bacterium]